MFPIIDKDIEVQKGYITYVRLYNNSKNICGSESTRVLY